MKILFITDNFPPERNAPAIRTFEHTREWVAAGHEVTVLTCAPNFPKGRVFDGYRNRLFQREEAGRIRVVRVWSYITANEGFVKRSLDYASFMVSAVVASLFLPRPDVVVATSPQFFAALAGWLVAVLRRRPWVFELRDLWPETITAVGAVKSPFVIGVLERLARFLYRRADLMVPVTTSFKKHLEEVGVPPERICVVTNGVNVAEIQAGRIGRETRTRLGVPEDAFVAAYVGTLGMCHGLSTILDGAELVRDDPTLHFLIMGEGAEKEMIVQEARRRGLGNVTIVPGGPREEALNVLHASDVALVMLVASPLFETVIPSKIFEAMALERPIVLGVGGEARRIVVEDAQCGLSFPPESAEAMVRCVEQIRSDPALRAGLAQRGLAFVKAKFDRRELAAKMLGAIERVVRP